MKSSPMLCWVFASLQPLAAALTIAEINGNKYLSPLSGQAVTDVTGLLIAKGPNGIWIRSTTPDDDTATSEAIYVFSKSVGANLTVGDIVSLDGKVTEYRSNANYIYLTEITAPENIQVLSSGKTVTPLVIGKDTTSPPTVQYSGLDGGDIYNLPNAVANVSDTNPVLDPSKFGLDFWESLSGELVTIRKPTAIKTPNKYGDTWVVGDWAATGRNKHGGLTMSDKGESALTCECPPGQTDTGQTPTRKPSSSALPWTAPKAPTPPRWATNSKTSQASSSRLSASTTFSL